MDVPGRNATSRRHPDRAGQRLGTRIAELNRPISSASPVAGMERIVMRDGAACWASNATSHVARARRVVGAALVCGLWLVFAVTAARAQDRLATKENAPAKGKVAARA